MQLFGQFTEGVAMRFGLQNDPAQAYSQWAPRERKNGLAQQAVQGALSKGSAWGTPTDTPVQPVATSSAASSAPAQGSAMVGGTRLSPSTVSDPPVARDSAAERLLTGGTKPSAASTAARHFGLTKSTTPTGGGSIEDVTGGGDEDEITIPPNEDPPPGNTSPPASETGGWTPPMASLEPDSSKMAPRIVVKDGKTYLSEHGKMRPLANEQEIKAAQGYVTDYWTKFPTGFQPGVGPQSNAEYTEPTGLEGVDQSKWDTDNYDKPAYITTEYGGVPAGWDATNWSDPNMQTPKYVIGRIISKYDLNDQAQIDQAVAEMQKAYPGLQYDGKDKINFGDGWVDFITAYGGGNATPGWYVQGAGGAGSAGGGGSTFTGNQQLGGDATSLLSQILPQLLKELGLSAK